MALREEVLLSIQRAQQQIDQLQNQLAQLSSPLVVPVDVQGEEAVSQLRQQLDAADEQVDVTVNTQGLQGAEAQFRDLAGEIDDTEDELRDAQIQADRLGDELDTTGTRGVQAFGGMRSALGPLAATLAAGIGLNEVIDQLGQAVSAASDLEQSIGGVQAIFGDAADEVLAFGESADQAVGLSANAFNELTAQLGAQLQAFGFSAAEAGDEAIRLVELGADLAATFGGPVSDAVGAVGSLLRGEINPIERYGVAVNQAAITANALEEGLIGASSEMDIQTRALSALDLLFEQTTGAQGQFGREADTTAGQLERQRAQMANVRAELGEALIPAVQSFLDITPDLIAALEDLGPAFASSAESAAAFFASLEPITSNLPQIIEGFGLLSDVGGLARAGVNQTVESVGSLVTLRLDDFIDNLGEARDILVDFQDVGVRRVISIDFLNSLQEGEDNSEAFAEALEDLFNASEGVLDVETVREFAEAAGVADEAAAELVQDLILQARAAGVSEAQLRVLEQVLRNLGGVQPTFDGALVGFENLETAADRFAAEGGPLTAEGFAAIEAAAEGVQFDTIIRSFDDLGFAAEEAGLGVLDFVNNLPDDVILDLSDAEQEVLDLIGALDEASTRLAEIDVGAAFGDVGEVDDDTGRIVGDIDQFLADLEERSGDLADLDFDLSQIQLVAPNLAELLAQSGLDSADIAAAFAANLDRAAEAEALITGAEGLAAATAEAYGEFLQELTPQQLADLAVFGADNLVSPAVRGQLGEAAGEIALTLATQIAESPELVLDLANAAVEGIQNQGQEIASQLSQIISQNIQLDASLFNTEGAQGAPSGATSSAPGTGGGTTQNVEVQINNATTEDVSTSATQAAQTIQAVSSSLSRVQ